MAARLLELQVRIPLDAWKSVSYKCLVLSGRGLCDRLFPSLEILPSVHVSLRDQVQQ